LKLERNEEGNLEGYQRPGSDRYINDIAAYLRERDSLLPNSIVLSLPTDSTYRSHSDQGVENVGSLEIPVIEGQSRIRVVDGQQRMRALAKTASDKFPVPVTGFITDDVAFEREQFFRINRSLTLPSGLVNELLPVLEDPLPDRLEDRRVPSMLCEKLDREDSSPLKGMIRRKSKSSSSRAVVKDSSIMGAIQDSLSSPSGCLFFYHNIATGEVDMEGAFSVLTTYWTAVREVFPDAWGLPPKRSRLMHSAGIQVMGNMMDLIMRSVSQSSDDAEDQVKRELERFAPVCQWTSGSWNGLSDLKWNELKGTNRHVSALTRHLTDVYFGSLQR
jgi:DGQHR domain-containing protein